MAVREFDGTDDKLELSLGNVNTINQGACTIAAIAKWAGTGNTTLFSADDTTASRRAFLTSADDDLQFYSGGTTIESTLSWTSTDDWCLVAVTKAAGVATPRFHKYVFATDTWTHQDGPSSVGDDSNTLNNLVIGEIDSSFQFDGRIGVVGAWQSALADVDLEGLTAELSAWLTANADGLWPLNQPSVTTDVEDITGGGSDQTSRVGTAVIAGDDPPGFDFGPAVIGSWVTTGTSVTALGAGSFPGHRLVVAVIDRSGGETATVGSSTDPTLDSAFAQVAECVTLPANGSARRSVFLWQAIVPAGISVNPIITTEVLDASSTAVDTATVVILTDAGDDWNLSVTASADSDTSTTTSQTTGTTATAGSGNLLIVTAAAIRGETTTTWDVTTENPGNPSGGTWSLTTNAGTGAGQRLVTMGFAAPLGQSAQTWADTLTLGTARMVSALIAVWEPAGVGPVNGVATANLGFSATATGQRTVYGTATAALGALTATATGQRTVNATATAALGFQATALAIIQGVATADLGFTATATGAVVRHGVAIADLGTLTATAKSTLTVTGVAVASLGFTAAAVGERQVGVPRFILTTPTFIENLWTRDILFVRYRLPRGVTLAVLGSSVVELTYPYQEDLEQYDFVYLGGHEHRVTSFEADILTAAGYGSFLTPI